MKEHVLEVLLRNPRTTAVALLVIAGALRNPENITAQDIENVLLAIGLIFAKDAGAGGSDK